MEKLSEAIFGKGMRRINLAALSRATGISKRTLFNYRECPESIPLGRLILIMKAQGREVVL